MERGGVRESERAQNRKWDQVIGFLPTSHFTLALWAPRALLENGTPPTHFCLTVFRWFLPSLCLSGVDVYPSHCHLEKAGFFLFFFLISRTERNSPPASDSCPPSPRASRCRCTERIRSLSPHSKCVRCRTIGVCFVLVQFCAQLLFFFPRLLSMQVYNEVNGPRSGTGRSSSAPVARIQQPSRSGFICTRNGLA